jgi:hypothetical protein
MTVISNHFLSVERAMTPVRFFSLCGVVLLVGCSKEKTFTEPSPPLAGIHFLNAVPDTGQMDFRVVDVVSNSGLFDANFRGANMFYTGIEAGTRRIKVFMSSTDPAISSQVIADTAVTLAANTNYTFIHTGFARTGQIPARTVLLVPDNAAAPAAGQIALRVIHAGAAMGNIDVHIRRRPADPLPNIVAGNVPYGAVGAYAALPVDAVAADSTRIVVTAAGTVAPVLFSLMLPTGVVGTSTLNPTIAGARVAGSVLTAVVVPASVVGSQAPQGGAFAAPSAIVLVDRRP